ncbi:MAG: M43 family zinc metalloprotease [Cytophagales bacterium]
MKKQFFSSLLVLLFLYTKAQDSTNFKRCATDENRKLKAARLEVSSPFSVSKTMATVSFSGTIVIPVVVHVVHNQLDGSIGTTNISESQITSQIQVLNEDFRRKAGTNGFNANLVGADVEIEFQLAKVDPNCLPTNGITRHYSPKTSFDPYTDEIKIFDPWPANEYLNIWVGNLSANTLGVAQFPSHTALEGLDDIGGEFATDGVVIRYNAFGTRVPTKVSDLYYLGRTTTHEIGHWLGLLHTWGAADFCGTDYCNDTPQATDGNLNSDCRQVNSNCTTITSKVMIENYLDYSPDICMNIFTQDQKSRMRQTMTTSPDRSNMLKFMVNGVNTKCVAPPMVAFSFIQDFEDISVNVTSTSAKCVGNKSLLLEPNISSSGYIFSTTLVDNTQNDTYTLSFDNAYPNAENTDTLLVVLKPNCKLDHIVIASFLGDNLVSTSIAGSTFTPTCSDWKSKKMKFNTNFPYFELAFKANENTVNNLYIDNIRLESSRVFENLSNVLQVNVLGNPVENKKVRLDIFYKEVTDLSFEIIDIVGQKVFSQNQYQVFPGIFELNVSNLNGGIYVIRTKVNNEIVVKKVFLL